MVKAPDSPDGPLRHQTALVQALHASLCSTGAVRLFETHISWVLVTEAYAYKIKKAVRFDFLDFSTLAVRRHYCQEELRLNRRLAPELYLDVLPITGHAQQPQLAGEGPPIEFAIRMRTFGQDSLWSERIAAGTLVAKEIDQLADKLLQFHADAPISPPDSSWATSAQLWHCANDILATLEHQFADTSSAPRIADLLEWHRSRHAQLGQSFAQRKQNGFVRECHGDLHCANLLTLQGQATAFDCIEFSEELRWIDVLNDLAFPVMDLQVLGRADLAMRLLNRYLEFSGDYFSLDVLRYYAVLRALVRCKIHLLRLGELAPDDAQRRDCERRMHAYLAYAEAVSQPKRPALMIMHGFSGSGKSTVAGVIVEQVGALRLRSDVERKRLHGVAPLNRTAADNHELYAVRTSEATYARLSELARHVIQTGWPVVVDAAFLERQQRLQFFRLAQELNVPFVIIDVHATELSMRARLAKRAQDNNDPSDADGAVLTHQLACHDPLSAEEMPHAVPIDSAAGDLVAAIGHVVARIGRN